MDWFKIISWIVLYGPKVAAAIKAVGNPISWVQEILNLVDSAGLVVDGVLGPKTQAAVKHFQTRLGIPVDGLPGLVTQLALGFAAKL